MEKKTEHRKISMKKKASAQKKVEPKKVEPKKVAKKKVEPKKADPKKTEPKKTEPKKIKSKKVERKKISIKSEVIAKKPKSQKTTVKKKAGAKNPEHKKTQKKQIGKTILGVLGLLALVGASVLLAQLVVEIVMLSIMTLSNGGGVFTFSGTEAERAAIETFQQPVWTTIFSGISYVVAMGLIVWGSPKLLELWRDIQKKRGKKVKNDNPAKVSSREELGLRGLPTWADVGLGPAGFVMYLFLAAGLLLLFSSFPWFDAGQQQEIGFSFGVVGIDRLLAFVTLVVVAPIAEEIIFRGWLYNKLRRRLSTQMSNVWGMLISIFLVSLLFGAVHRQLNVGINVFAMSVIACGLREVTGTIYAGMFLHIIKNGIAFYLLFVLGIG